MLSQLSGYSISTLSLHFHLWLEKPPTLAKFSQNHLEESFLLVDGLWFGRWFVMMVYRQHGDLTILRVSVGKREVSTRVAKDFKSLLLLGYRFTGIISDDHPGIIKAVHEVFPHIPYQICLAHIHRRAISLLGRKPKDGHTIELRILADHVWKIESHEALYWWRKELLKWEHENRGYLAEYRIDQNGHWWYIHKGARKALNTLLEASQICFTFLSHPTMPKTTNEIEAQFGYLGRRWLSHRGLKRERWEKFLCWFVYLYNEEKLSDRKSKKAV